MHRSAGERRPWTREVEIAERPRGEVELEHDVDFTDGAEGSAGHEPVDRHHGIVEQEVVGLDEHKPGRRRDVEQAARVALVDGHRLLAHHVVPGRERRLDEIAVGLGRGEDVDDVESVVREHLGRVRVVGAGAVALRRVASRHVGSVAHRHELGRRGRSEVPEVLVCDRAAADHAGAERASMGNRPAGHRRRP